MEKNIHPKEQQMNDIHPLDILSGKVVQNKWGTFWFKDPGYNLDAGGFPIFKRLHRDNDLPPVIWYDGNQFWYKDGKCHRDNDLPAIIRTDGIQQWYRNGEQYNPEETKK